MSEVPVSFLSSIEEVIEDARPARMFILVDDEDRENEGDLVIPAEKPTPEVINFMARHGRGLICLSLTRERVAELGLPPMAHKQPDPPPTAFTVSIEAREGVTTGISAADRARTIAVAIDPAKGRHDIVTPGHVFPLVGAGRRRAGSRRTYRGSRRHFAARRAQSVRRDLRDHERRRHHGADAGSGEVRAVARAQDRHHRRPHRLPPPQREADRAWSAEARSTAASAASSRMRVYANKIGYGEHIALVRGDISGDEPVLVRMHQFNIFAERSATSRRRRSSAAAPARAAASSRPPCVSSREREPRRHRHHPRADADQLSRAVAEREGRP